MRNIAIEPGFYYHVYNRGVSKQIIFHNRSDYRRFEDRLILASKKYDIQVEAYCLMPNHYHLMVTDITSQTSKIPQFMHSLQMSYSKYYNHRYDHSGAVFQGNYQAKLIQCEASEMKIKEYISNNPVRAGLVFYGHEWPYTWPTPSVP